MNCCMSVINKEDTMSYQLTTEAARDLFRRLGDTYMIYAPVVLKNKGRYSYTDSTRYEEVTDFDQIDFVHKTEFSAKEVLLPVNHTIGVKMDGQLISSVKKPEKPILLLLRPCDRNAIGRMDEVYKNDEYYQSRREGMRFVLISCNGGWDTCFCTSLGTNETDSYDFAVEVREDAVKIQVKAEDMDSLIAPLGKEDGFQFPFVENQEMKVEFPKLREWDWQTLSQLKDMPVWKEYAKRCIGCGSCNMACSTCTCLRTQEVPVSETADIQEVHRVWGGCQVVMSQSLEKGKSLTEIVPRRVLQRVLDKYYRPRLDESRELNCVGCGRCIDICPRLINFGETVNKFAAALNQLYEQTGATDEY